METQFKCITSLSSVNPISPSKVGHLQVTGPDLRQARGLRRSYRLTRRDRVMFNGQNVLAVVHHSHGGRSVALVEGVVRK